MCRSSTGLERSSCSGAQSAVFWTGKLCNDAHHYLAISAPVPFRMESRATSAAPLLAVYMDFDLNTVAELVELTALRRKGPQANARSLLSSPMERGVRETLLRLLTALADPWRRRRLASNCCVSCITVSSPAPRRPN
jgi:AraC-type transcriptional regulator N-terminus